MQARLGRSLPLLALGFVVSAGCFSKSPVPVQTPAAFSRNAEMQAGRSGNGSSALAPVARAGFDPDAIRWVLDSPELQRAREAWIADDSKGAADELAKALSLHPPDEVELVRWHFQLGKLRFAAGELLAAAESFDRASGSVWPLRNDAVLGAAQALVRAGHSQAGAERARTLLLDPGLRPAAMLLLAEVAEASSDHLTAAGIWREYLETGRHPPRWIEVALREANALLAGATDAGQCEQAALLARRVSVEAPLSASVSRALEVERRALARVPESPAIRPLVGHGKQGTLLPSDIAGIMSVDDQVVRANALLDAQHNTEARGALEALLVATSRNPPSPKSMCQVQLTLGSALAKLRERPRAADMYEQAIQTCGEFSERLPEALYRGGKASASAGRLEEAVRRFARLEAEFPAHRYADDARLRGAESVLEGGDEARFVQMIQALPNDYPEGDMASDSRMRLATFYMSKGDFTRALPVLEMAEASLGREAALLRGGQTSYWLARSLWETGNREQAVTKYREIIGKFPLSYYMLQAQARLSEADPEATQRVMQDALMREPADHGLFAHLSLEDAPVLARIVELFRQGDMDAVRKEIAEGAAGGTDDRNAWVAAFFYARAGSPQLSHALLRGKLSEWLSHYPVGGWRRPWEIAFPRPFQEIVDRESKKSGIEPALAYAIMREESSFEAEVVSPARAYGLMQLIVPTAKHVGKAMGIFADENTLCQPEVNIALGCRLLAELRGKFPQNAHLAVPAYNAGPGAPVRWLSGKPGQDFDLWVETIPFEETRKYTKRVLTSYAAYSFLYDRERYQVSLRLPRLAAVDRPPPPAESTHD